MGCISSKAFARSISIREEYFNPSFRGKSVAWEELLSSNGGNDHQILSFIRSESRTRSKRRTGSFTLPAELLDKEESEKEVKSILDDGGDLDFSRFTRSKSCQISREKETSFDPNPNPTDNKLVRNDKNLIGSRSFHTVEEYDQLLERIHNFRASKASEEEFHSWLDVKLQGNTQSNTTDSSSNERGKKEDTDLDTECESPSSERTPEISDKNGQKGWKRKAVAKELQSLDVSSVEFPAVARTKQWIQVDGQVYSPGSYVTPKFGSYNGNAAPKTGEERSGGNSVFSPELVAVFEECMQQLQEEEDNILNHMDAKLNSQ